MQKRIVFLRRLARQHVHARAGKTAKSFEEATDLAIDALKKQLQKTKDKFQNKRPDGEISFEEKE